MKEWSDETTGSWSAVKAAVTVYWSIEGLGSGGLGQCSIEGEGMVKVRRWVLQGAAIGLGVGLLACSVQGGSGGAETAIYQPNTEITKVFPRLKRPLLAQIEGEDWESQVSVYFPENYNTQAQFPVLVWLGGGAGSLGNNLKLARQITQNRDFVCVNLPLYKRRVEPLAADESNAWGRLIVQQEDSGVIWQQYRVLLDAVLRSVPNLDRSKIFLGGFSNGANTTAVLLNDPNLNLFQYFNHFILVEGGNMLSSFSRVQGHPLLILEGDERQPRFFEAAFEAMEEEVPNVEYILMEETGHELPERYQAELRRWMLEQL